MSKKVTIPTDGGNPFVIIHNGIKYIYSPGETVTVSDGVALEIEEWKRWREKYRNDDDDLLGDVVKTVNGVKPDKNGNVDLDAFTAGYVTPEMFGAKGDGVTNDYEAFKKCITFANKNNTRVTSTGKTYYVSGDPIDVYCDIKFSDSTIILDSYNQLKPLLRVPHDSEGEKINTTFGNVFASKNKVKEAYKNKFFVCATDVCLGKRYATGEAYYVKTPVFANGTLFAFPDPIVESSEAVIISNISEMDEKPVTIEGIHVKSDANYLPQLISVERNNTVIKNITCKFTNVQTSAQGYIINCQNCNNIYVDGLSMWIFGEETTTYKYCLSFYDCSNITIKNSKLYGTWEHAMSSHNIYNITFDNVESDGLDCHVDLWGNIHVLDCRIGTFAIGYGDGNIIFDNTALLGNTQGAYARNDITSQYKGKIVFNNCNIATIGYEDSALGSAILSDASRDQRFDTIRNPKVEFHNCTIGDMPVLLHKVDFNMEIVPVVVDNCTFSRLAKYDGDNYPYVFDNIIIENCNFEYKGGVENLLCRNCHVYYNPSTVNLRFEIGKTVFDGCTVDIQTFNRAEVVLFRRCHIKRANYSSVKADSVTFIDCTGTIEACAEKLYVFGGQYKNIVYNDVPTLGCLLNCYIKTIQNAVIASTNIMTANILDSTNKAEYIALRNSVDISDRPDFSEVLYMI